MSAWVHLLTSKIIFSVGSLTRHTLELLSNCIISMVRYIRPVLRQLRHVVTCWYLYGVRVITCDLRMIEFEWILSIVNSRLARNRTSQSTLIFLGNVRLCERLLLLLLLIVILNIAAQEYVIVINCMIQLLLLVPLVVFLIPNLIDIVNHVANWIVKWLIWFHVRVHYVVKRIAHHFWRASLHLLHSESIMRPNRAFLHLHLFILLLSWLLLLGIPRMHHLGNLLWNTSAIHIIVHVIGDTRHDMHIMSPGRLLHVSHLLLHILVFGTGKAANMAWNLPSKRSLSLKGCCRSPIHHSWVAGRSIPNCLRLGRLILHRLLDLFVLLVPGRWDLRLHWRACRLACLHSCHVAAILFLSTLKIHYLNWKTVLGSWLGNVFWRKLCILIRSVVWMGVVAAQNVLVVINVI